MSTPELVVLTGAAGRIGAVLRNAWRGCFSILRLVDSRAIGEAAAGEEILVLNLEDLSEAERAMEGADAVVHLAAIPTEDVFSRLVGANVRATYNVFEAARRAGVRRVVFASTNHVTGFYPAAERIGPDHPVRPDSVYAATKVFGEALARLYADKWDLEVVCVRIGSFAERPTDLHSLSMWLSPADAVQLFTKALTATNVGFVIVYGLSRTSHSFWDNPGARLLGYEPVDEADASWAEAHPDDARPFFQGGRYVERDFWIEPA